MAEPGLTPRSPVTMVAPVLVTVEAPRTAKLAAEPRRLASKTRSSQRSSDSTCRCCKARFDADLDLRRVCKLGRVIGCGSKVGLREKPASCVGKRVVTGCEPGAPTFPGNERIGKRGRNEFLGMGENH